MNDRNSRDRHNRKYIIINIKGFITELRNMLMAEQEPYLPDFMENVSEYVLIAIEAVNYDLSKETEYSFYGDYLTPRKSMAEYIDIQCEVMDLEGYDSEIRMFINAVACDIRETTYLLLDQLRLSIGQTQVSLNYVDYVDKIINGRFFILVETKPSQGMSYANI